MVASDENDGPEVAACPVVEVIDRAESEKVAARYCRAAPAMIFRVVFRRRRVSLMVALGWVLSSAMGGTQ